MSSRRATEIMPDGSRFEGRFIGEQRHGRGVLHFGDGGFLAGCWTNDVLAGPVHLSDRDGATTSGRWEGGGFIGDVVECYPDGEPRFKGEYRRGERNGTGTEHQPDGSRLEGIWNDGVFEGPHNVYHYPDGKSRLRGQWVNGGEPPLHVNLVNISVCLRKFANLNADRIYNRD